MTREALLKLEKEELVDILLVLFAKVAELEARLNQNSKNSSNPPSSDKFGSAPKSLRKPSSKKVGGQKGHKGSGLRITQEPTSFEVHYPASCADCPRAETCISARNVHETRYSIDIVLETTTTAHQTLYGVCPKANEVIYGEFPCHITGTVQYGVGIEALAIALNSTGAVSINRTHEILSGVFNVPISTGTISNMVSECAKVLQPTVQKIKEAIIKEPVIHDDETGIRVEKKNFWAHVTSTSLLTYIAIHAKRGREAMEAIGILPYYCGTVVHDCFASYFTFDGVRHSLCNAHILRELTAVIENTGQQWAQELIKLLLEMKVHKEKLLAKGRQKASRQALDKYSKRYDELLAIALQENPVIPKEGKGKVKRGKTGALVDRLILRKDGFLLFFNDFSIPFDNNQAERDIRMFKVKQKVSGGFRTFQGAVNYSTIMSYIGTARKHGISAFIAIKDALLHNPFYGKFMSATE